ncbi:MAG: TetR family transcriptional regulator [Dactylosporangium sp.]|nr:TetR family transcriptional regulator [Dactylosporangium sp.]
MSDSTPSDRPRRRYDPGRRERLIEAALDAESGVAGTTHRRIAAAADVLGSGRDLVLSYELYAAAVRNPALRHVTQGWMERSRRALERHFDPATARALDALIEGLVLHSALSTAPMTTEEIRAAVHRMTR